MPIYEFQCLECNKNFEMLMLNKNDEIEMKCSQCNSFNIQRVVSRTNFVMTGGGSGPQVASSQTHTCSGGSCTTYDIPGPK